MIERDICAFPSDRGEQDKQNGTVQFDVRQGDEYVGGIVVADGESGLASAARSLYEVPVDPNVLGTYIVACWTDRLRGAPIGRRVARLAIGIAQSLSNGGHAWAVASLESQIDDLTEAGMQQFSTRVAEPADIQQTFLADCGPVGVERTQDGGITLRRYPRSLPRV